MMSLAVMLPPSYHVLGLVWHWEIAIRWSKMPAGMMLLGFILPPSYHVLGLVWHWEIAILTALGFHLA
jgi:hypothetical protein